MGTSRALFLQILSILFQSLIIFQIVHVASGLDSLVAEVTLQKCPWASFPGEPLELPPYFLDDEFKLQNRSITFKFSNGKPECGESDRTELSEPLQRSDGNSPDENRTILDQITPSNDSNLIAFDDYDGNNSLRVRFRDDDTDDLDFGSKISIRFSTQGLLIIKLGSDHIYRERMDYCIQDASENLTVSFCKNACTSRTCIPKCCPRHQVLDFDNSLVPLRCSSSGVHKWTPKFHQSHEPTSIFLTDSEHKEIKSHTFVRPLDCEHFAFVHESMYSEFMEFAEPSDDVQFQDFQDFRILKNGTLIVKEVDEMGIVESWTALEEGEYCIDGIQNYRNGKLFSGNSFNETVILRCPSHGFSPELIENLEPMDEIRIVVYWITIPFASLFLILTIIVFILVWDTHNIHGHTLFSYVCSLFGFYVFLFLSQIRVFKHGTIECALTGGGIHLFFLITACWLTTINFDVWYTFRNLKAGRPSHNLKRYLCYSGFSFGVPICILLISVLLNNKYKDEGESSPIIIPNYGKDVCALSNASVGYYLYTPIGILIGCNIIFFLWTIWILLQYQRSIGAALKGKTNTKEDQSLSIFVKLFVVMGISWIFEIVGWAVQKVDSSNVGLSWFVAVLDLINLLMAVAIFFIFVWKRVIFEQLWLRHPSLRPILNLCIAGGCCIKPNPRPSFSAQTVSTLGRNGTIGRTLSSGSGSGNELMDLNRIEHTRKLSRTLSSGEKKLSIASAMSTLSETDETNLENDPEV